MTPRRGLRLVGWLLGIVMLFGNLSPVAQTTQTLGRGPSIRILDPGGGGGGI